LKYFHLFIQLLLDQKVEHEFDHYWKYYILTIKLLYRQHKIEAIFFELLNLAKLRSEKYCVVKVTFNNTVHSIFNQKISKRYFNIIPWIILWKKLSIKIKFTFFKSPIKFFLYLIDLFFYFVIIFTVFILLILWEFYYFLT